MSKPNSSKNKNKISKQKESKKSNTTTLIAIAGIIIIVAAVGYALSSGGGNSGGNNANTNSDDPGKDLKLPSYAYANNIVLNAYKFATLHPEALEQIPCYCGCGMHGSEASDWKGHRFLRDCYMNDKWQYDVHASQCDVCVGEANRVESDLKKGLSLEEIRAKIDKEYGSGGGIGTSTPPVDPNYVPILIGKAASQK